MYRIGIRIWIFMLIASSAIVAMDPLFADLGISVVSPFNSEPIDQVDIPEILDAENPTGNLDTTIGQLTNPVNQTDGGTVFDFIVDFVDAGASAVYTLISLLTGTLVLDFLESLGMPSFMVLFIKTIYGAFLMLSIIFYIRGAG